MGRLSDSGVYERLARCLVVTPVAVPVGTALPIHECKCGGLRMFERVVRYPGWGATLIVHEEICASCGHRFECGRMIVTEILECES